MTNQADKSEVISYYNEVTKNKLHNYINGNPRVDEAWKTIIKFKPEKSNPLRILEVGCGVGAVCNRMNKRWPSASIVGIDISTKSIDIANRLFANQRTRFMQGILTQETFQETFDLIIFMDVYEHIAVSDRPEVHAAIKKLLSNKGRLVLAVPTPHNLKWSAVHKPETMQPVDEHISFSVINNLATATDTEVLLYEVKSVWNTGDYAHIVMEKNADFQSTFFYPKPSTLINKVFKMLNRYESKLKSIMRGRNAKRKLRS